MDIFLGFQNNLKIRGGACVSRSRTTVLRIIVFKNYIFRVIS